MKNVLVINANPKPQSLCRALAQRYAEEAGKTHQVRQIDVAEMQFEPDLRQGYATKMPLEPDLLAFQEAVRWAQHLVIVTPVWWGTVPAKFKGLIDRTFLPGFAFRYVEGKVMPEKLLRGRTAELIVTLDTPVFWYKRVMGNPIYHHLKHTVLGFVGIRNRAVTYFGPVIKSSDSERAGWFTKVARLARRL